MQKENEEISNYNLIIKNRLSLNLNLLKSQPITSQSEFFFILD